MALRIHTLYVANVIAILQGVTGVSRGFGSGKATHQQPRTCTGPRPFTTPADGRARRCAERGADSSASHAALAGSLIGRHPTNLFEGILPAHAIVGTELFKALASTGQNHCAGATRNSGACTEQKQSSEEGKYWHF
jgi:hypothetical protein